MMSILNDLTFSESTCNVMWIISCKKNQAIQTCIQFFLCFFLNLMKEKYEVPGSCYQQSFFLRKKKWNYL